MNAGRRLKLHLSYTRKEASPPGARNSGQPRRAPVVDPRMWFSAWAVVGSILAAGLVLAAEVVW